MADVSTGDRGQLILVGGISVAFALVALVLLLNTALVAQNVATRGLGPAPDRADDHAAFAEHAADRILRQESTIEYGSWAAANANTTRGIRRVSEAVRARQFRAHGAFATVDGIAVRRGAALVQTNASRTFTSARETDDWTLTETTGIRNFTMTVDAAATSSRADDGNFTVAMQGADGSTWAAEVYSSGGHVAVHANGRTCTSTASVATINWSAGTLADCSFPIAVTSSGAALDAPYTVTFANGGNATGTYHVVVSNESGDTIEGQNFGAPTTASNPRQYPAVYSVRLSVRYVEETIDYETHVRAAPGEPERTRPPT